MSTTRKPKPEGRPSEYTVLARRYRPQQFRDLVGQEPVARALVNALESNRVAHAYLFTGARGVGKTSTARILAKALNCQHGPTPTPCDQCEVCRSIASGEDIDVLEIDGASNNGVEQVRELRRNVQLRPNRARYKIYIIDEVHMLSGPAFNALLKTLEEPPAHVKFIFATTEIQKIPITILSRCQRFDFAGIGTGRIVERLRAVVDKEGMKADDDALQMIARRAGGSMRDAQSLLDQLLAFGGESKEPRLTAEQVNRLLGTANEDHVVALAAAVLDHDAKKALGLLAGMADEGLQLGELLDQLTDYWRDLMVANCAGPEGQEFSVTARHHETLQRQAAALSVDTVLAGLDILGATKARLRGSSHGRVLLEMALVRLSRLEDLVPLTQLAQALRGGANLPAPTSKAAGTGRPAEPARLSLAAAAKADASAVRPAPSGTEGPKKKDAEANGVGQENGPVVLTPETLDLVWREVLRQLGPVVAAVLGKAAVAISGPNALVLRFAPEYNYFHQLTQEPGRLDRVEDAVKKITGAAWKCRAEALSSTAAGTQAPAPDAETSQSRYRRQRAEAMQAPLVKRAIEILEAQIVQVDDGFGTAPAGPAERPEGEAEEP